jgi:DNA-binding NarL/FixJ family response regulator
VDDAFKSGYTMDMAESVSQQGVARSPAVTIDVLDAAGSSDVCSNHALRKTIERLGADAAIITFEQQRPILRRIAYLVGFDQAQQDKATAADVLALAMRCWSLLENKSFISTDCVALAGEIAADPENHLPISIKDIQLPCSEPVLLGFGAVTLSVSYPCADSVLHIALLKKASAGPFPAYIEQAIDLVQPGMAEIAQTRIDMQRANRRVGIMEGMLDTVSHGIILLDSHARPFYTNDIAKAMMKETGALKICSDHVLRCHLTDQTQQLHLAIRTALQTKPLGDEIIIKLQGRDGVEMLGFLMPAVGRQHDPGNRAAILMIHKMKIEAASSALMRAFGLLPSEQRFLTTFLQASSLSHAAASLDLSEETARTYLKRICSKLGVRRQIELASLMFGLSPPIRRKLAPVSGASI